ncbi:MAG TPA: MFS transporter [Gemmatimonadaceae bacterium]|nr:MFS transporter [Gemmatimonadaceae bacterium]
MSVSAHDPYAALRVRDFRLYLAGNLLATVGSQMQTVAVGWELYERTRQPMALGLVGLVQVVPVILLTLPVGHVVDRVERRLVLMASLALLSASSLGLAFASATHARILWFYVALLVAGIARAFQGPAKEALAPQLVPRELYANSSTWRSSSWQLASVLGPALGGAVIGAYKRATPAYVLDAGFGLCFLLLAAAMAKRPFAASSQAATFESLMAGVRFVARTKVLLAAITLDLFAVLLGGATTLLPMFAKDILHVGPTGLGWLLAAPSVGAFVTALVLAHRPPMRRTGRALTWAVIGFGVATIVFGLSRSFWLSLVALLLTGAFDNVSVVIRSTLMQLLTPEDMRGRVGAVNSLFIGGSNELGGFESGAAAALVGPVAAVVLGGVGTVVVVLTVARVWPEVARLGPLQDVGAPVAA